jgi:hypothetical protein
MTKQATLGLGTVTLGVIVALAAVLLFASAAFAAGSISGSTQTIAAGGAATVTISETPVAGLGNWQIDAAVPAATLGVPTCVNIIAGGGCNIVSGNIVRFAGADGSNTGLTGTQTIGTISVTATAALTTGCAPIVLTATHFQDQLGADIASPTITNGQVCIAVATNSPSPTASASASASASPTATAATLPTTGGPLGNSSSISLSWLLGAAGLFVIAGGAWTLARARREEN